MDSVTGTRREQIRLAVAAMPQVDRPSVIGALQAFVSAVDEPQEQPWPDPLDSALTLLTIPGSTPQPGPPHASPLRAGSAGTAARPPRSPGPTSPRLGSWPASRATRRR